KALIEELYAAAITVISNENNFLPLKNLDLLDMASITIGNDGEDFRKQLDKYDRFAHYSLRANSGEATYRALEENLKDYNTVVVGIMDVSNNPKRNYGIKQKDIDFIKKLSEKCNVITVLFGNSYAARYIDELPHA